MDEQLVKRLLLKYGAILQKNIRKELAADKYQHARGYRLNAYNSTPPRNKKYKGKSYISRPGDNLYESVKVSVDTKSNSVTVDMADYAAAVNFGIDPRNTEKYLGGQRGRGGSSAFISALQDWAQNKFNISSDEALGAAFAIRKNIFRFGTEPREFYGTAIENTIMEITEEAEIDADLFIEKFILSIEEKFKK